MLLFSSLKVQKQAAGNCKMAYKVQNGGKDLEERECGYLFACLMSPITIP